MRSLTGEQAPKFNVVAVINGHEIVQDFSLDRYKGKKYIVFLFHPMGFTFACPTKLHAFQERLDELEKRNVAVVDCSVDSEYSHFSWLQMPKSEGGAQDVEYPIVSGSSKSTSESYGILVGSYTPDEDDNWVCEGTPVTFRGLLLIDKEGVVRHRVTNGLSLGRDVDRVSHMVDVLQHFEEYGEVCPADWSKGKDATEAIEDGVTSYLGKH